MQQIIQPEPENGLFEWLSMVGVPIAAALIAAAVAWWKHKHPRPGNEK